MNLLSGLRKPLCSESYEAVFLAILAVMISRQTTSHESTTSFQLRILILCTGHVGTYKS